LLGDAVKSVLAGDLSVAWDPGTDKLVLRHEDASEVAQS